MMTTTAVERNDEGRRWTYSDLCVGDALIGHDLSVSHLRRVHAWLILGRTEPDHPEMIGFNVLYIWVDERSELITSLRVFMNSDEPIPGHPVRENSNPRVFVLS
jgi:hypothetical protein